MMSDIDALQASELPMTALPFSLPLLHHHEDELNMLPKRDARIV